MIEVLENLIKLYKTDSKFQKGAKEIVKTKSEVSKNKVETTKGHYKANDILDILNLYHNHDYKKPLWMRLFKYGSFYQQKAVQSFRYDATIDDDNKEGLEDGDLVLRTRFDKTVSQELDNVCLELKRFQFDQSSSFYSSIPAAKPKESFLVGGILNKELYTYI